MFTYYISNNSNLLLFQNSELPDFNTKISSEDMYRISILLLGILATFNIIYFLFELCRNGIVICWYIYGNILWFFFESKESYQQLLANIKREIVESHKKIKLYMFIIIISL